ncbi:TAXI family TRAP transporter solute-binding subunit [Microvirga sp. P5_D2]
MSDRVSGLLSLFNSLSRLSCRIVLAAAFLVSGLIGASAQPSPPPAPSPVPETARANAGTLGVISGGADGTYIRIAADLANVLDGEDLRILPMIGRGSLQNLRDIMFLRGVDIGIVQMDAREQLKVEGLQDNAVRRLRFITRLYNEEVHIIASRDITDIKQLDGKKVNIDKVGSGTNLTSRLIFDKLGIKPELTTFDQASSYARLKSGEIQAAVYVAGRPVRAIAEFQTEGRFHLLSIPFEGEIAESYFPARFANNDYPQLVDTDKPVETLAVGSLLAVFNWPENSDRYNRVRRFVNAFFSRFDEFLQPGRHPKWKEVNLAADVPGWERVKPAQEWLDRMATASNSPAQVQSFESFMNSRGISVSAEQRDMLFREFLTWQSDRQNDRQRSPRRTSRQE